MDDTGVTSFTAGTGAAGDGMMSAILVGASPLFTLTLP